jgi:hypothetical protein
MTDQEFIIKYGEKLWNIFVYPIKEYGFGQQKQLANLIVHNKLKRAFIFTDEYKSPCGKKVECKTILFENDYKDLIFDCGCMIRINGVTAKLTKCNENLQNIC